VVDPFCYGIGVLLDASKLERKSYGAIYEDLNNDKSIEKSQIFSLLKAGYELGRIL